MTDVDDYWEPYDEAAQCRAEDPPEDYLIEEAERYAKIHRDQEHGGAECDCPVASPDEWEYAEEPPF